MLEYSSTSLGFGCASCSFAQLASLHAILPRSTSHQRHLADLKRDPVAEVARVYQALGGVQAPDNHAAQLVNWLANNKQDKYGLHSYNPVDFGLTEEKTRVNAVFKEYCTTFRVQC